ncbi:MAG: pyruvate kinase [Alphaproteobacteria bacterium]|nr:pyruvate kinase [Alphaproteobacteria bacterium]
MHSFTKIIATLGPGTEAPDMIEKLILSGVDVFRINFSHGDQATHHRTFQNIRRLAQKLDRHIGIVADLQGPKLRVGMFIAPALLKKGQAFRLDMDAQPGDERRAQLMHPEIYRALKKNMTLLLNDGRIQLRVVSFGKDYANTRVVVGGALSNHKGINLPHVVLPISALTEKDRKDLAFALKLGVDWICLSFVQQPADIIAARALIGDKAGIIAKIEKPSALAHLKEIVELSDAVMVARGDLGVECPIESVPLLQRRIIGVCRAHGRPVIVATQMLESMISAPIPTRAEVSDVANAVYEGADAVMLSAETAIGQYPVETARMMKKIIHHAETDVYFKQAMDIAVLPPDNTIASAMTSSMRQMLKVLGRTACIVSYSVSGQTTLRTARERPLVPIVMLTTTPKIADRLTLAWGVRPVVISKKLNNIADVTPLAVSYAKENKLGRAGDEIIMTAGIPLATHGNTNILHVVKIK